MTRLTAVVADFGGVLTTPLFGAFARVQEKSGVPTEALGRAMAQIEARDGAHPLFELERGRISERDFLAALEREAGAELGRPVSLNGFAELWWSHLEPNEEVISYMRDLRDRGYAMALLTNNVREWEPRWRAMLPVDEIFSVIVDSAFVGMRKPERAIYELTIERLGVPAAECLFLDDIELNCDAARSLGMTAVVFHDTAQAIAECEQALRA